MSTDITVFPHGDFRDRERANAPTAKLEIDDHLRAHGIAPVPALSRAHSRHLSHTSPSPDRVITPRLACSAGLRHGGYTRPHSGLDGIGFANGEGFAFGGLSLPLWWPRPRQRYRWLEPRGGNVDVPAAPGFVDAVAFPNSLLLFQVASCYRLSPAIT